jgi:transposase-like protein
MRKNQKYTQEEMYIAIELWKESGLSQKKYCKQNHLSLSTFRYWQKKYQKDKSGNDHNTVQSFIPVHIPQSIDTSIQVVNPEYITITYPNGIKVNCPVSIHIEQLHTLIKI